MKMLTLFAFCFFSLSAQAFVEEEVHFAVSREITLKGYLTRPNEVGTYPALVLQMGHGQGTTDHPTRTYNPFAELARKLADQGYMVFRFDKRGTGYNLNNGSYSDGTFSDYVNDLKSAIKMVGARKEVDSTKIYLFGHSLGGPVISIAARDLPLVKGIILSSAPGRHYSDFNLEQMRYLLRWGEGLKGEALENALAEVSRANSLIDKPTEFCREFPFYCQRKNGKIYLYGQIADFWREISQLDPLVPLTELECKIASIQGSSDWVISSENDGGAIAAALSNNPRFVSKTIPGLDHFVLNVESKEASVKKFIGGMEGELAIHPDFIPAVLEILRSF